MALALTPKSRPSALAPFIEPMLATLGAIPAEPSQFAHEIKWDGIRAIATAGNGSLTIHSRNGNDITTRYPELAGLASEFGRHRVVLDGEIISLGADGRPSFARLQHRMHLTSPADINRLAASQPIFFVIFDLLQYDRRSLQQLPYTKRRLQLESLGLSSEHWQVTPARIGDGAGMLQFAQERRLEGVVAKRLDSIYRAGKRSPDWIKVKLISRQEFVIGGWVPQRNGSPRIGALLIGVHDETGKLRYAGKVGTGLTSSDHAPLLEKLDRLSSPTSPFADEAPRAEFVKPSLVAEVEFRRWPANALVHQAAFKGLRTDKKPAEIIRESAPTD